MKDTAYRFKRKGVQIKSVSGDLIQMVFVKLDTGFISEHVHLNEQMGYILVGKIELTIEGDTRECNPGDVYHIAANVQHSFKVLSEEPAEILETFCPPKDENR